MKITLLIPMCILLIVTPGGPGGGPVSPVTAHQTAQSISSPTQLEKQTEFNWKEIVIAGQTIEIQGVNGDVSAELAQSEEAEVIARIRGAHRPDAVKVQPIKHAGGILFCATYPVRNPARPYICRPHQLGERPEVSTEVNGKAFDLRFANGGGGEIDEGDVRIDFVVRVPRGVHFVGYTMLGDVRVNRLSGHITAQSTYGDVRVDLPEDVRANISAESKLGDILSDFNLPIRPGKMFGASCKGDIGSAERKIILGTVTGQIQLQRVR